MYTVSTIYECLPRNLTVRGNKATCLSRLPHCSAVSYTHLDVYKRQVRASTVDILLKTNLAVRPLPELEIEQEHHAQQNSPDIRIQFMTCLLYTSGFN